MEFRPLLSGKDRHHGAEKRPPRQFGRPERGPLFKAEEHTFFVGFSDMLMGVCLFAL